MDSPQRINRLRQAMENKGLHAYVIPTSDPHQSEYVAEHWKSRVHYSGFTGSAGTLVVYRDNAQLWTDSRYFLQAEEQLADTGIDLAKIKSSGMDEMMDAIANQLDKGQKLGFDSRLFTQNQFEKIEKYSQDAGFALESNIDLPGELWDNRPAMPEDSVFEFQVKYAGEDRNEKLDRIRESMDGEDLSCFLLNSLDDIAWTFNLRGSDVECNPVFYAYAAIEKKKSVLFVEPKKISADLRSTLNKDGIELREYSAFRDYLVEIPHDATVGYDADRFNAQLVSLLKGVNKRQLKSIPLRLKAQKNETEITHLRNTMVKDGVALLRAFRWLENELEKGATPTEYDLAEIIAQYRSKQSHYIGESFHAIVGYRANGAIVHYRPLPDSSAKINPDGLLLVDSGGQYLDGTTDITRTISLGNPTDDQKKHFTWVLKGHIALAKARFPKGTHGVQLDILARKPLWDQGLNFGHGTGHGVGFFLNVHEPPQGFMSGLGERGTSVFKKGMLTSNEPGYYEEGSYGIRIENLVLCVPSDYKGFYQFETLTIFPISSELIDTAMMDDQEVEWLNQYNEQVKKKMAPYLDASEKKWLEEKCRPL